MKIGVVSDIHSNKLAFEAVLEDLHQEGIQTVICLGDVVGRLPWPDKCIKLVREQTTYQVVGNHDLRLDPTLGFEPETEGEEMEQAYLMANTTEENREWVYSRPHMLHLDGSTLIAHSDPRKEDPVGFMNGDLGVPSHDYVSVASQILSEMGTRHVLLGHTHNQHVVRTGKFDGVTEGIILNPGSVGIPYAKPAEYAILDTEDCNATVHTTSYDVEYVEQTLRDEGMLKYTRSERAKQIRNRH